MPDAFRAFFLAFILASTFVWSGWGIADEKGAAVFDEEEEEIPPGFKNIDAARETEVEIWFRDRKAGSIQAEFTTSWIRFFDAAKVVGLFPDVLNAGIISAALAGKLSANQSFICHQKSECPIPEPEIASVVFDARHFRATVYINPAYLKVRTLNQNRYLSGASTGFSAIQGLSLSMSGARAKDSTDHYSWYGRSVMAFQENHVFADWNYDKTEHANISSLYLERDLQGQEIQGGLFGGSSFGLSFSADSLLLGGRIAHSSETLVQDAALNITPLVVFLPVRGRVEIYRDGKLLDAMLLEAGRQQIDTNKLPQGAYNLTIKVFDGTRLVDEQTQLFVKSNRLPGRNDPIYFFEIGRPMENVRQEYWPRTGKGWVGRGGYSFLLQESTSLSIASTVNNSDALVETGLLHLGHSFDFAGGIMLARHNRQGLYGEVRWHGQGLQSQASYRELNHKKEGKSSLLEKGFRSGQFSVSSVIQDTSVELGRDWKKAEGDISTTITDHVRMEWPLIRGVRTDLRMSITGSRTKNLNQLLVGLTLAQRTQFSEITFKQTRQETRTKDNQELAMASRVDGNLRDLEVVGRNSINLGGFVERQRQQRSVGADMTFTGQRIGGRASINRTWPEKGENVTNYIGQFSTSLLASAKGIAIGGSQLSDSAALVVLEGEGNSQFDILVNDRVVAKGQTGERVPVTLSPYGEYGISIRPAANSFSDYEERVQHVTLYPGNVAKVKFEVTQVEPVLGRIQNEQGKAISGAVLENSQDKTVTDGRGLFQTRLVPSVTALKVIMENGQTCLAKLPTEKRKRRGVVLLGKLVCIPDV
ncbi:TcfC E-set like domain-containing protein [Sansalvadorimonas sp. 2012CJ34-2]|uniref:TcfC E-set like domain-containing protein n=1 Tax=Parendozoicomonas callyspongiae TaxID=2942213 RepID=A0ABT0PDU4_9GAMM|nr:TcfC E-set like domain-containing protein [Sansalvadorimonas sp. 2012CJ34-2]MCL6269216.1 TcfC E-set like domain-containing protein [Sansalvadorimonas sp. 2012CJ34-2]